MLSKITRIMSWANLLKQKPRPKPGPSLHFWEATILPEGGAAGKGGGLVSKDTPAIGSRIAGAE
jgi:hypothetical protein